MKLFDYLTSNDFSSKYSVCFLQATEQSKFVLEEQRYPLLFFSLFFNHLRKNQDKQVAALSLQDTEADMIMSQLTMSFLGSTLTYWFGDIAKLEGKKKHTWTEFLSQYQGPHTLFFFSDVASTASGAFVVDVPCVIQAKDYEHLVAFFRPDLISKSKFFIPQIFAEHEYISLDTACLLLSYQEVIGMHVAEFSQEWLIKMLPSEKSLFTLSQYFFAKDGTAFFELWQHIKNDYPDVFWISYWSEQVWRAFYFVKYSQQKNVVEAKKIAYKLPFSFIQRDWRSCKPQELSLAHMKLYALDCAVKNGASDIALEHLYSSFFAKS